MAASNATIQALDAKKNEFETLAKNGDTSGIESLLKKAPFSFSEQDANRAALSFASLGKDPTLFNIAWDALKGAVMERDAGKNAQAAAPSTKNFINTPAAPVAGPIRGLSNEERGSFGPRWSKDPPRQASNNPGGFAKLVFFALFAIICYGIYTSQYVWAGVGGAFFTLMVLFTSAREEFFNVRGLLIFSLMFLHLYLVRGQVSLQAQTIVAFLFIYLIALILLGVLSQEKFVAVKRAFPAVILNIVLFIILALVNRYVTIANIPQFMSIAVTVFPVLPLYFLRELSNENANGYAQALMTGYLLCVAILLILGMLMSFGSIQSLLPSTIFTTDISGNAGRAFSELWNGGTDGVRRIGDIFKKTLDPGTYYTGEVEKNKKAPLGVTIVDLNPLEKKVANTSDIVVQATVRATSFIGEQVRVVPTCLISGKNVPDADLDPEFVDVIYGGSQSFVCTFPAKRINGGEWRQGTYTVTASGTFDFQTWAYIPYTFVDQERALTIARQGLDMKTVLGITEMPQATFTSGPVAVGMGGARMPILIRTEGSPMISPGSRIGMTVDSAWEGGTLRYVKEWQIKVPEPFKLTDCTPAFVKTPLPDTKDPAYTSYVFENPVFDGRSTYKSVTCQLAIDEANREAAMQLVSSGDKVVRSFVAVATYSYAIEQKTTVQVI